MAGERRLDITLHYDGTQGVQASQQAANQQKQHIQSVLTAQEVAEKAKAELIRRTNQQLVAEAVKAGQAQTATAKKTSQAITQEELASFSQRMRKIHEEQQARDAAAQKRKQNARMLLDIELFQMQEAHQKAMAAWDAQVAQQGKLTQSIKGAGQQVLAFGTATLGLQSAQGVLQMFVSEFEAARSYASKMADDIQRMREGVRELQALRGEMGQTGAGIAHVFEIAAQTSQTPQEVQQMESAGLGVGELALKNDKDRAEFTKAMVAAGRFQAMEGGDAGAYGQMMGQIALQGKGPLNADQMEAQAWRLFQIQQPGGFKNMSQAMGQYAKLNSLVQNGIYSPEEAMSLASAFSVSSPEEAATHTEQFTRAVMAGRIKSRGMQVSGDVDLVKTDEYFKSLGIGRDDSAIARGKKIADDLARQQAAAQGKGGQFNSYEYLMSHGFGNAEDREAIMSFAGLRNTGSLEKIEQAAAAPLDRGAITKQFSERAARDPMFARRMAENSTKAADTLRGQKEEDLKAIQEAAFARLRARGDVGGWQDFNEYAGSTEMNFRNWWGGDRSRVNLEVQSMLAQQARKAGVDFVEPRRIDAKTGAVTGTDYVGDEKMRQLMLQIRQAGGNPLGSAEGDIKQMAADMKRLVDLTEKRTPALGVPAPMPGKPVPIHVRP